MNYILNSIKDIRKVYTPNIENLNTNNDFLPFAFCGIENTIFKSMRFFQYHYCGDDYEKESLSLKEFNFKNKSHHYKGINYEYLIKNIDLKVFETELDKLLTTEENRFVFEIKKELEKTNNFDFQIRLKKNVEILDASDKFLIRISEGINEFDKILVEKYRKSYKKVYDELKKPYEHIVTDKTIFPFWRWGVSNGYGVNFINGSSGNEIHQDLFDKMKKGQLFELNHINLQSTENTKRTISEEETISINDILSEPIKKLTECGFYEVLQTKYPEIEKQQSIIATVFRIHINKTKIRYNIITVGTQYYNFCFKIGLIEHLEKPKFQDRKQIAKFLNEFSSTNEENVNEINIRTFENIHTNQERPQSKFYPFSNKCEENVNVILSQLNLI